MINNFEIMRRRAGLTQEASAHKLGITQGAVSQWENGLTRPRADMLPKLAELYDCTVDELLSKKANQPA